MDDLFFTIINKLQVHYLAFVLIAIRFFGAMSVFPLLSNSYFGKFVRMLLSVCFSMLIFPSISVENIEKYGTYTQILLAVKEFLVGFMMGYIISIPIWVIEGIGKLIDHQRGENLGASISKLTNNQDSSIGKLLLQSFVTYFIVANGFLFFLEFIYKSFLLFPIDKFTPLVDSKMLLAYVELFKLMAIWISVLALPVVLIMFLLEMVLGIISTFLPQMNVTILSMPVKSCLAIFVLILYVGNLYHFVLQHFLDTIKGMYG